jgi:hypothetical protein
MRGSRLAGAVAATIAVAACALAPAAPAATTPVVLGNGQQPAVAVDASGNAYITWAATHGTGDFFFCNLPRGASACANGGPVSFTAPVAHDDTFTRPFILREPTGALVITIDRAFHQEVWTSADNGATWTPSTSAEGTNLGDRNPGGQAILAPDNSGLEVITATTTGGVAFQYQPFTGGPIAGSNAIFGGYEYDGTLAVASPTLTVAAFWRIPGTPGATNTTAFSLFHGAPGAAMNSASAWTPLTVLDNGEDTHLSSGPAGVGLLENLVGADGVPHNLVYRRFDGTSSFGPAKTVFAGSSAQEAVGQDASGRVHAVWINGGNLLYGRSDDGGTTWRTATRLVADGGAGDPQAAAAPDGQGVAVYTDSGTVRAIPLSSSTTGTGTGPGTTTSSGPTACISQAGLCNSTSVTVGSDVVTLQTPAGCVRSGTVVASLFVQAARKKGHVVVKVGKVQFRLDSRLVKTVLHKPFKATFRIRLAPGSSHTLSAKAFLRSHDNKQRTRTLKNTFKVC